MAGLFLKTSGGLVNVGGTPGPLDSLTDVNAPAPSNNQRLAWDDATQEWIPKQSTSALGMVTFPYDFNTSVTVAIASGDVALNNATQPSATELFISATTTEGDDISTFLELMEAGSWINIYDKSDAGQTIQFDVTATPTEAAGVFTVPVTNFGQAGAAFTNNQKVTVLFRFLQAPQDVSHNDLLDVTASQHHTKYTDGEAVAAGVPTFVSSPDFRDMVQVTQAEYDGLTPDADTLYIIVG